MTGVSRHFSKQIRLLALTISILICFTISWVLAKNIIDSAPLYLSAIGRVLATSIFLWAFFLLRPGKRVKSTIMLRRWPAIIILALLGFVLYSLLTFLALTVLNPSDLGMTLALIPGFTYTLGLVFFGERIHRLKLLGIPLATGAALYYTTNGFQSVAAENAFGIVMAAGAALSYALYGLIYKKLMADLPMTSVLPFITTVALLMFLPWLLFVSPEERSIEIWTVAKLLILGAGLSAPVFLMYHAVIDLGGVLYANSIGILSPFAILLTEWIFGYRNDVTLGELSAMVACAIGVALIFKDAARQNGESQSIAVLKRSTISVPPFDDD